MEVAVCPQLNYKKLHEKSPEMFRNPFRLPFPGDLARLLQAGE
ncbi:hypothetical protein ANACOL_00014 [Anaerotruncus colihominis DSM 17241]|uniref:Uncharacterized protein n=1 Tax=Anaerotruncus colihominis DSM 17241 TaxID=445972 RepID=B0P5J4_9FIRM|nr:hypothetical protein ANACOL_00014 [Anaerotruncus colihominis DSM 17241]